MEPTYNPVTSKDDDGEPDIRHVEPSIAGRVLDIDFISGKGTTYAEAVKNWTWRLFR